MTRDHSERSGRFTDRRSVLKGVGAAGLTLAGANVVQGTSPGASDVFVVKGSPADPVTDSQREEALQAAIDTYRDRGGDKREFLTADAEATKVSTDSSAPGDASPDRAGAAEETPNVVHVVRVDANGRTSQYDGFAADERSVARRYQRAAAFRRQWEDEATTSDVETQNGWDEQGDAYNDNGEHPYGEVTNYTVLSRYNDNYVLRQSQGITPGSTAWDTSWVNHKNQVFHNWDVCELANSNLAAWEPSFEPCGNTSTSVSLDKTGPSVSWTYSQDDVCIDDRTDTTSDLVELVWTNNSDDAKESSHNYETGSELYSDGGYSCDTHRILGAESNAIWEDCGWWSCDHSDWYKAIHWWNNYHC